MDRKSPLFTGIIHKVPEIPLIYTLYLPVTTEHSRISGREMANYPEFIAGITFSRENGWITCRASAEGENILMLSCRELTVKPCPRQRVCTVTLKNDRLLRSEFNFSEGEAGISKNQSDVKLEFGSHPVGQELKALGARKILQYQYFPSGKAILSSPSESYSVQVPEIQKNKSNSAGLKTI
jgi:hypothetical protein